MDPVLERALRRRCVSAENARRYGRESAWAEQSRTQGVHYGLRDLRDAVRDASEAPGESETPAQLASLLREYEYSAVIREDEYEDAHRALVDYKEALARWVETGMARGEEPSLD